MKMTAMEEDLAMYGKRGSIHGSLLDCLGFDSDQLGEPHVQMLLTDQSTISIGNNQIINNAGNTGFQITLRQQNIALDTRRTYIVGRFACKTGIICKMGYKSLFQVLETQLGATSQAYSFQQYYNAIQDAREKQDDTNSISSLDYDPQISYIPKSYDNTVQGAVPTILSVLGGTSGSTVTYETLDPYQILARRQIENYFAQQTGQFVSGSPQNLASAVFAVPLCELTEFLAENPYIFLGMGQTLRMMLRTTSAQECVMQCLKGSTDTPCADYQLSNMGIYMTYVPLQNQDLERILKSRIEIEYCRQIPYQIFSQVQGSLNLQFSLSVQDKVRSLKVGFFSNMINPTNVLGDSTNTATNIIPQESGIVACQLQSSQLQYFPLPAIYQIVLQMGQTQRVINTQQLQLLNKIPSSSKPYKYKKNPLWAGLQNPLCLDLTPYTEALQQEGGCSIGGSTSLLIQILISPQQTPSTGATDINNSRTMAYQQKDWSSAITSGGLKCMAFVDVSNKIEVVNGIYQA